MINELASLKCRFCGDPVAVIVEFEAGCACYPDRLQALCMQHWINAESVQDCRVVYGKELSEMNIRNVS
jgi:hypothetical protein